MPDCYLLDANVIYSYTLRDCFITLAVLGVPIRWSANIETEYIEARRRRSSGQALKAETVVSRMRTAVPDYLAMATPSAIARLDLPDPDDRHVLAAAIQAKANIIVTNNKADFPADALASHGVLALTADDALCQLHDEDPDRMLAAAASMRGRMIAPSLSAEEWLERLVVAGAPRLAARLRGAIASL